QTVGPLLEHHPDFPERTNVEFVSFLAERDAQGSPLLYQRTWERGSGETLACGSGACAVAVAAHLGGHTPVQQTIRLRGGDLLLAYDPAAQRSGQAAVFMSGPGRLVFQGTYRSSRP
ncbi:MAG: hypothetical protein KDK39_10275, partial [Leptospiraceae bacterium]|nr:hypothetical protein [Leptospiraceae bacterium]